MDPEAQTTALHDSDEVADIFAWHQDHSMDEDGPDEQTTFAPASYTQHYLGSPMSWRISSMRRHDVLSQQDFPMRDASRPASLTRFLGSPMSWQTSPLSPPKTHNVSPLVPLGEKTVEEALCTRQSFESKSLLDRAAEPIDLTGQVIRESEFAEHGGSYADIYIGSWYPKDERPSKVAVKVIRAHIYKDSHRNKVQKRLNREIRIWASLKHLNVLPLLGTVTDFGRGVLSMGVLSMVCPWMEEGDLAGYLVRQGNHLTRRNLLNICQDIANGLEYIHSRQVVHRDLTTANILIDHYPLVAKLSDFGLSNVIAELQGASFMTSKITGSARWAAPELFPPDESARPEPNFSTDVYSLGSVIFHVMSGKVPYDGLSEMQVMLQVMNQQPPTAPTAFNVNLTDGSGGFWHIIKGCWETDPPSRPTVREVGQMIAVLQSE